MSIDVKSTTKLTYEDYCLIPDDGRRHEIIDGVHYVNAAPSTYHQHVSKRLQYQLYTKIELAGHGVMYNAPVDVHLTKHDVVQPDLVVILNAKKFIITPTKVKGVPDLLVEILSPSSIDHDRERKRNLYESCGIPEYWIVDPFDHKLEQLVLRDGRYQSEPEADTVRPTFIADIAIPLNEVW
jgi:Uma2 family endonuclease